MDKSVSLSLIGSLYILRLASVGRLGREGGGQVSCWSLGATSAGVPETIPVRKRRAKSAGHSLRQPQAVRKTTGPVRKRRTEQRRPWRKYTILIDIAGSRKLLE